MEIVNKHMIAINQRQNREQNRAFVEECPLSEYDTLANSQKVAELALHTVP